MFTYPVCHFSSSSAPFSPINVSGIEAWYDADDASTISHSSGAVSQWNDKSQSATVRNVTQGTAASRPTTNLNTINGRNVLSFDGGDVISYTVNNLNYDNHTIFMVFQPTVLVNNDALGSGGTTNGDILLGCYTKYRGHFWTSPVTTIDSPQNANTSAVIFTQAVGTTMTTRINGVLAANSALSGTKTGTSRHIVIGSRGPLIVPFIGNMAEIIIYNNDISTSDYNSVGNYLSAKWGMSWTDV